MISETLVNYSKTEIEEGNAKPYLCIGEANLNSGEEDRLYDMEEEIIQLPVGSYNFKVKQRAVNLHYNNESKVFDFEKDELQSLVKDGYWRLEKKDELQNRLHTYTYEYNEKIICEDCLSADITLVESCDSLVVYKKKIFSGLTPQVRVEDKNHMHMPAAYSYVERDVKNRYVIRLKVTNSDLVYFSRPDNYNGEFGLDIPEFKELDSTYEILKYDSIEYKVPYLSFSDKNENVEVIARLKASEGEVTYTFTSENNTLQINGMSSFVYTGQPSASVNFLKLNIKYEYDGNLKHTNDIEITDALIVKDQTGKIVGKINVAYKIVNDFKDVNYRLVFVNVDPPAGDDGKAFASSLNADLEERFNKTSYNQSHIKMEPSSPIVLNFSKEELYEKYMRLFANDIADQEAEIAECKKNLQRTDISTAWRSRYEDKIVEAQNKLNKILNIFTDDKHFNQADATQNRFMDLMNNILEKGCTDIKGNFVQIPKDMGFEENTRLVFHIRNYGGVSTSSGRNGGFVRQYPPHQNVAITLEGDGSYEEMLDTHVHEMGHSFDLPEAFAGSLAIKQNTSSNYMDYYSDKFMFWHWQWKMMYAYLSLFADPDDSDN